MEIKLPQSKILFWVHRVHIDVVFFMFSFYVLFTPVVSSASIKTFLPKEQQSSVGILGILENFAKFTGKHLRLQTVTLTKNWLRHRCKYFKNAAFIEHIWLIVSSSYCLGYDWWRKVVTNVNPFSTGKIERLNFWDANNSKNFKHQ